MAYTVIWFSKHAPEASRTAHVSSLALICSLLFLVVLLPVFAFYVGYTYMAPENIQNRLERQTLEVTSSLHENQKLKEKIDHLNDELNKLQIESLSEINKRAEAEARVSMVEIVKSKALEDLNELKKKNAELRSQLDVFRDILQPTSENLPIQCYNVSAEINKNGQTLNYKFSLLKTDNKDTQELSINLQVRVLAGVNLATLDEIDINKEDQQKQIKISKLLTTSGKARGNFAEDGVRVLDVRGYEEGAAHKLLTHCWKSF